MGYDLSPMKGRPEYRLRVGSMRVVFERNEESREILVKRIGSRGDIYKRVHEVPREIYGANAETETTANHSR